MGARPLGLADTENLGAADRANPLGRRAAVLQGNLLRISDLLFSAALKAVSFHEYTPHTYPDVPA